MSDTPYDGRRRPPAASRQGTSRHERRPARGGHRGPRAPGRRTGPVRRRLGARPPSRPRVEGHRPRGLRHRGRPPSRAARRARPRQHRRPELHRLQGRGRRRLAAPHRVEAGPRPPRLRRHRRPLDVEEGGRAAARLHRQRHRLGPRAQGVHRPLRRPGDLDGQRLRVVDPATFGDDSLRVLRGVQLAARFELTPDDATARICGGIALDDLPAERIRGEMEKLLLQARRPSLGFELALRTSALSLNSSRSWRPSSAASRSPSGIPRATSGCTRSWSSTRPGSSSTTSTTPSS